MKVTNKLFMTGLAMAALIPAFQAHAQYKPTGDDGITASPKLRQRLNEQTKASRSAAASSDNGALNRASSDGVAASPKVRIQLEELKRNAEFASAFPSAGLEPSTTRVPNDGIAASPKLREQMRQFPAPPQVEIAPIVPAK
jgi:hypothetical protein